LKSGLKERDILKLQMSDIEVQYKKTLESGNQKAIPNPSILIQVIDTTIIIDLYRQKVDAEHKAEIAALQTKQQNSKRQV